MKQKYPSKLVSLRFYDIRSGKLPKEDNLMLFILVGDSDLVIGGYSNRNFWDGVELLISNEYLSNREVFYYDPASGFRKGL